MRIIFLNILLICSVSLAMPADTDINMSVSSSNQNGNRVQITRRSMNGVEKQTIDVSAFNIKIDGDDFTCGPLKCPKEAFKCHVTSEAIAHDRTKMKTTAECQDKSGRLITKTEVTETNPHPSAEPPYSRVGTVDREGNVETDDSIAGKQTLGAGKPMTPEQQAEFNKSMRRMSVDLAAQNEAMNRQMEAFNRDMANSMNEMQKNMAASFGNNFLFGNSNRFGNNFPFNPHPFPSVRFYDPYANFHTFFYPPTNRFNGYNGFGPGVNVHSNNYPPNSYDHPNNYPPNFYDSNSYEYNQPESRESEYAVEEFKPVYHNNYQPVVTHAPSRFDRYRYDY